MPENGHTPGPWEYQPAMNYVGFSIAPVGTRPTLAAVERPRGEPRTITIECFNFPGETEANARLIAAAPDLLIGCREAIGGLVYSREIHGDDPGLSRLIDRLMVLVAKANGETSFPRPRGGATPGA